MAMNRPKFMDSPYFVDEPGNWHLKPGAPEDLKKEFKAYIQSMEDSNEPGSINGVHIDFPYDE